jgi:DNA-binding MarR family transcriptional regulator
MNSNYRQYYLDDPQFYLIVIRGEQPPYEFKIHLFLDSLGGEGAGDRQYQRDLTTKLMDRLQEMGAININDTFMKDKNGSNDKIRVLFTIEDQQKAIACYDYFTKRHFRYLKHKHNKDFPLNDDLGISQNVLIYLQKPEDVFVRYGDIEAELYNEMEKIRIETEEKQRAEFKRDGGPKKQGKPNARERQYN